MDNILKVFEKKVNEKILTLPEGNEIKIEEKQNIDSYDLLSNITITVPKKWEYFKDYVVLTLDENNLENINYFPEFKEKFISAMDNILVYYKENSLYFYHIELKSSNFSNKEIFKKYVYSRTQISNLFKLLQIDSILGKNKWNYNIEKEEHKTLVFHKRSNYKAGFTEEYKTYTGELVNLENINTMLSKNITCKNTKNFHIRHIL